jgi:hypothetical protein
MKRRTSNASLDAVCSFSSSLTSARQRSDERTSVARKFFAANVDLPDPDAPTRTTSDPSGTSSARPDDGLIA